MQGLCLPSPKQGGLSGHSAVPLSHTCCAGGRDYASPSHRWRKRKLEAARDRQREAGLAGVGSAVLFSTSESHKGPFPRLLFEQSILFLRENI